MRFVTTLIYSILMISLWMSFFPEKSSAEIIDRIVAQVGPQIITLHDVQMFAPSIVREITSMPEGAEKDEAWAAYMDEALEFLIYHESLEIAAGRFSPPITVTESEIQGAIVELQEQNTQFREQVRAILAREQHVTPELYLFVKQIIIKSKLNSRLSSRAVVTEADVRYYLKQQPNYSFGAPEYNISIVFLPDRDSYDIFRKEVNNKTDFAGAAQAAGQSVINMGWLRMEDLVSDLQEALKLMPGSNTISKPVVDDEGRYVVMKLSDTRSESGIPEHVRAAVTRTIAEEQMDRIFDNWFANQRQFIIVSRF